MAAAGHLERMGRELKCPICLNLLESAASLSCNHVFCNSCITSAMKSASLCPICKIPFHRRDIRPSPHMDSLVTIFKNMESDAGKSFDSDPETSHAKLKDIETESDKTLIESARITSFPSTKRVHVDPHKISNIPLFSPFFWIREDEDKDENQGSEKSTPPVTSDSSCPLVPCFSDMKDEDDINPKESTPMSKPNGGEIFDSEMFEWTQRACSPEIWHTPSKDQIHADQHVDKCSSRSTVSRKRRLIMKKCSMNNPEDGMVKKTKKRAVSSGMMKAENVQSVECCFCHSSRETEVSGEMVHYLDGKPIPLDCSGDVRIIHSHKHCAEWAPNVFFEGDKAINLSNEVLRSKRIKCSHCKLKGAALGCLERTCRKSYHYTCAKNLSDCHWDQEKFVMLCPLHASTKSTPKRYPKNALTVTRLDVNLSVRVYRTWSTVPFPKWVLCCSSLSTAEKEVVSKLVKLAGISLSKKWNPSVSHVIVSVDDKGACKRTMKFLMGVAEGKWIVNMSWVNACLKRKGPVKEGPYEIKKDVHGACGGPRRGRLRAIKQGQKLFEGYEFYFWGEFSGARKGLLQELVSAAGGEVLRRKPMGNGGRVFVIYSIEEDSDGSGGAPAEAAAVAEAAGCRVVSDRWIMDSVAGFHVVDHVNV